MKCSSMPRDRRLMILRRQHAEHLLEVLRSADDQENERQKKLRRASTKASFMYLKTRFKAEREKTRRHIINLLEDAEVLEVATARVASSNQPGRVEGHRNSASIVKTPRRSARCSRGGKNDGVSIICRGETFKAILEPKSGEDPNFISTEKMRFLEYMCKHMEEQKAPARRKGVWTKASGVPGNHNEKLHKGRLCGESTGLRILPKYDASSSALGNARDKSRRSRLGGEPGRDRRRLLQQKREILLDLKEVIWRQAETLDRMAKADAVNRKSDSEKRGTKTIIGCFSRIQDKGTSSSGTKLHKEAEGSSGRNTTAVSRFAAKLSSVVPPLPPRPPYNATSTFLALGGRWGDREGGEGSKQGSSATSASFATYCDHREKAGAKYNRVSRRPREVPLLPIKGR